MLVNCMRQNFSEINPQFGQAPLEYFASPILGLKTAKNIGLKGRQIIDVSGASTCLGPGLTPVPADPAVDRNSGLRRGYQASATMYIRSAFF